MVSAVDKNILNAVDGKELECVFYQGRVCDGEKALQNGVCERAYHRFEGSYSPLVVFLG